MENGPSPYMNSPCLICKAPRLLAVGEFSSLPRITSDCREFASGGELAVCENCAMVQKIPDARWLGEIAAIYGDYAAYSIAGGEEQLVLDPRSGEPRKRSEVLVSALRDTGELPESARALDVGCGHGVTLTALGKAFPAWKLFGHEIDESKKEALLKIRNFQQLYTGDFSAIERDFDFVSMIHSLEHFVDPLETLKSLRKVTKPDGRLFVEVCNVEENPFDLLVADHLTHFSPATLAFAVRQAGFAVSRVASDWVKKEISLLATNRAGREIPDSAGGSSGRDVHARISAAVSWLNALITDARATAANSTSFGIFGTSIAGTWLAVALGDKVRFFVDEDPNRVGKEYMGKPIFSPQTVPEHSTVFLALAPVLAKAIKDRLSRLPLSLVSPAAAAV